MKNAVLDILTFTTHLLHLHTKAQTVHVYILTKEYSVSQKALVSDVEHLRQQRMCTSVCSFVLMFKGLEMFSSCEIRVFLV